MLILQFILYFSFSLNSHAWNNDSERKMKRLIYFAAGRIVLDTPLPHKSQRSSRILNIKPIAVCASGKVEFLVKVINLSQPTTRYIPLDVHNICHS